jgi:NDP-sugar pyrophosphorylase family protein
LHNNLVTVAVHRGEIPVSLGVIDFNDEKRIVNFREKPSLYFWGSMGIYVFSPELWDLIPPDTYYGFDSLMADMLAQNRKAEVFPWLGLWLDIGRPEDYERATDDFLQYRERFLPSLD